MTDWRIFKGDRAQPHNDIWENRSVLTPPKWRQFSPFPQAKAQQDTDYWSQLQALAKNDLRNLERGQKFFIRSRYSEAAENPDEEHLQEYARVIDTVNAALYLRRPLLVTGQPGSGKTSLAYAIAYQLQLGPVLAWPVTARTVLQDGLYQYDAIARLRDAQLEERSQKPGNADGDRPTPTPEPETTESVQEVHQNIGNYIRLGSIGTDFVASRYPRVLLIDEIDKSDINLPNDLLNLFEEGSFIIPELKRLAKQGKKTQTVATDDDLEVEIAEGKVQCSAFPLVVMTSNGERDFPPAFLRRCLRVKMPDPNAGDLQEIVKAHLEDEEIYATFKDLIDQYIDRFLERRDESDLGTIATDQLLNTIHLLTHDVDAEDVKKLEDVLLKPLTSLGDNP
jgi:MoxR-like ATPase